MVVERSLIGDVRALRDQIAALMGSAIAEANDQQVGGAVATMERRRDECPAECGERGDDRPNAVCDDEFVPRAPTSLADFSRLQLGRNDRDYAVPIAICALLRRLGP